jgi:tetratricopeptide (TPR) repeat protein
MASPRRVAALALVLALSGAAATPAGGDATTEARRAFSAGEYDRAAALLRAAIEKEASDASLHYWLARSLYELGQYDQAAQSAERAVALAPDRSEYHQWLGRALGGRAERAGWLSGFGLAKKVRAEFETAVRLDPHNVRAQRDLIEFYGQAPGVVGGGKDKAWRQAEALATVDPVEAHLARAELRMAQKQPDRAEAEIRAVMDARPRRAEPYFEVADFYEQRGDASHLAEAIEAAAALDPKDPRLTYYRGVAAALSGRQAEAERLLRQYLDTVPPRSDLPSRAAAQGWLRRLKK